MREGCAVLDWAASGAMALTGPPGGPPSASPAPALALLGSVTEQLATVTGETGCPVRADPAELISGRAALAGFTRGGAVSAGGSSFLLRAADGWCAVTLSRPDDVAAVPAIIGALGLDPASLSTASLSTASLSTASLSTASPGPGARAREVLAAAARRVPAADFAAAVQLLGVPGAALPAPAPMPAPAPGAADWPTAADWAATPSPVADWPPWRAIRIAPPRPGARLVGAVVADLSSMWAGPLCARLLGLAGADVIKVESPRRPDGARSGQPEFFDWLHAGHRTLTADFGTREGRAALAALLRTADVVIEASRPRALAAAGLAPEMLPHPDGQVWLSITGHGLRAPDLVAFGDDAAVAGGLVGWTSGPDRADGANRASRADRADRADRGRPRPAPEPVFCADAIADPLTGACGALAVARSRAAGGGERIDLPMRDVAAAFAAARLDHGGHRLHPDGSVSCPRTGGRQAVLPPRPPGPAARAAEPGADTAAVLAWLAGQGPC